MSRSWRTFPVVALLALTACNGGDRVEVRIIGKENLGDGSTRTCMVNVEITNRGSAMLRTFNYWLSFNDNRSNVPWPGPVTNIPAGGSKTSFVQFVGVPCAQVPARLELRVLECVMGERDCTNSVALRQ